MVVDVVVVDLVVVDVVEQTFIILLLPFKKNILNLFIK